MSLKGAAKDTGWLIFIYSNPTDTTYYANAEKYNKHPCPYPQPLQKEKLQIHKHILEIGLLNFYQYQRLVMTMPPGRVKFILTQKFACGI